MDRRDFFKVGAVAITAPLVGGVASARNVKLGFEDFKKEAKVNVVYHADFPQESRFRTMLRNITNHLSVYDFDPFKIKIVVVSHGAGAKFLLKDLKGTKWEKEKIDQKLSGKLYDFVKIVPSGVGTVAHLQTMGYAYIKVQ